LPAPSPGLDTERVTDEPISRPGQAWRPWTVWLACGLAVVWSGMLVVADGFAVVMGS
jgi:hypothetical protein